MENRETLLASTETLDLLGIAKTLLSRRARLTGDTASKLPRMRICGNARAGKWLARLAPYRCGGVSPRASQVHARRSSHVSTKSDARRHSNPTYHHLHEISRCRRALVRQQTAASLELMKQRFSAPDGEVFKGSTCALACLFRRPRRKLRQITRDARLRRGTLMVSAPVMVAKDNTRWRVCSPTFG